MRYIAVQCSAVQHNTNYTIIYCTGIIVGVSRVGSGRVGSGRVESSLFLIQWGMMMMMMMMTICIHYLSVHYLLAATPSTVQLAANAIGISCHVMSWYGMSLDGTPRTGLL